MPDQILTQVMTSLGPTGLFIAALYYLVRYFMAQTEKKDQAITDLHRDYLKRIEDLHAAYSNKIETLGNSYSNRITEIVATWTTSLGKATDEMADSSADTKRYFEKLAAELASLSQLVQVGFKVKPGGE